MCGSSGNKKQKLITLCVGRPANTKKTLCSVQDVYNSENLTKTLNRNPPPPFLTESRVACRDDSPPHFLTESREACGDDSCPILSQNHTWRHRPRPLDQRPPVHKSTVVHSCSTACIRAGRCRCFVTSTSLAFSPRNSSTCTRKHSCPPRRAGAPQLGDQQ